MARKEQAGLEVTGTLTLNGEAVVRLSDLATNDYVPQVFLTQAAYDALTPAQKAENKIYNIVAA